jgi:hypothetical protein
MSTQNLILYKNTTPDFNSALEYCITQNFNVKITENLDEFINSKDKKISFFSCPIHYSMSNKSDSAAEYVSSIIDIINLSDLAIFITLELHHDSANLLILLDQQIKHNNVIAFSTVMYNDYNFQKLKHFFWYKWFADVKSHATNLDKLNPYIVKPRLFDVLLGKGGAIKPHRHFLYDMINNSSLKDKVIMNFRGDVPYYGKSANSEKFDADFILDEEGIERIPEQIEINHSSQNILYFGKQMMLALVVPLNIYNQTAYSVITETDYLNYFTLFSEKTVKPIIAKRLFIMFAGKNYLKNLRAMGFQTFDGIIDETYDTVDDPCVRWALAFNQMIWLAEQPQHIILKQIEPIVEHNFKQLYQFNDLNIFQITVDAIKSS